MPYSSAGRPDDIGGDLAATGSALHLRHRADPAELRRIRGRIDDWAQRHGVPEGVLIDVQLALGEAVANGVEHAYRGGEPGTVEVDVEIRVPRRSAPVVAVRVTDHGRWRPIPLVNGYRGRGLSVIEKLARHVKILRTRGGTQVCFEIPLTV